MKDKMRKRDNYERNIINVFHENRMGRNKDKESMSLIERLRKFDQNDEMIYQMVDALSDGSGPFIENITSQKAEDRYYVVLVGNVEGDENMVSMSIMNEYDEEVALYVRQEPTPKKARKLGEDISEELNAGLDFYQVKSNYRMDQAFDRFKESKDMNESPEGMEKIDTGKETFDDMTHDTTDGREEPYDSKDKIKDADEDEKNSGNEDGKAKAKDIPPKVAKIVKSKKPSDGYRESDDKLDKIKDKYRESKESKISKKDKDMKESFSIDFLEEDTIEDMIRGMILESNKEIGMDASGGVIIREANQRGNDLHLATTLFLGEEMMRTNLVLENMMKVDEDGKYECYISDENHELFTESSKVIVEVSDGKVSAKELRYETMRTNKNNEDFIVEGVVNTHGSRKKIINESIDKGLMAKLNSKDSDGQWFYFKEVRAVMGSVVTKSINIDEGFIAVTEGETSRYQVAAFRGYIDDTNARYLGHDDADKVDEIIEISNRLENNNF